MPPQQYTSMPFWDFIQSLDPNHAAAGSGVDHTGSSSFPQFPPGFPFGPRPHHGPGGPPPETPAAEFGWGPWWAGYGGGHGGPQWHGAWGGPAGRRGGRGRRHRHGYGDDENNEDGHAETHERGASDMDMDGAAEKGDSPETMREDVPDPDEVAPEDHDHPHHPHDHRGPRRAFGRGGGCRRGHRFGRHGPPHPPPYPGAGAPPFDFAGMIRGFSEHPFFQNLREQVETYRSGQDNQTASGESDAFVPPVDIFNTERAFVLHVALPGAKKEDIGVNWDADGSVLNVAGVIYRPGDEEFLKTLASDERKIGMFERNVKLPPAGVTEKDEIDGFGITARMEDGVLIITVPKVEKEWTEIRKVDIE